MRGFTLFESLLVVALLALILTAAQPLWRANSQWLLNQEATRLNYFLHTLRERSQYSSKTWILTASRDPLNEHWCLTAQASSKNAPLCDCLRSAQCPQTLKYFPLRQGEITLKATTWHPQALSHFKNIRGSTKASCLYLQYGKEKIIFRISDFRIAYSHEERGACA